MTKLIIVGRSGAEKTVDAADGMSVMEVIRDAGFNELLALCGGSCSCATCHVFVDEDHVAALSPLSADENDLLDGSDYRQTNSRLSCQVIVGPQADGMRVVIAPAD